MNNERLIQHLYAAFNRRDVDGLFALMRDDVEWPNAMEGTMLNGKDAVREYWRRQWEVVDPRVEPLEVTERADGKTVVRVDQIVRSLEGSVISEGEIHHEYRIKDGLVARMDVRDDAPGNRFVPRGQGS